MKKPVRALLLFTILALMVPVTAWAGESDIPELGFRDFFQLPVGPHGLVLSQRLQALDGHQVRMSGYRVTTEVPTAGFFILAPMPVKIGDEDESLADDLPASIAYVQLTPSNLMLAPMPGRLWLTGTLHVGQRRGMDGRLSFVHLQLDAAQSAALLALQITSSGQQP